MHTLLTSSKAKTWKIEQWGQDNQQEHLPYGMAYLQLLFAWPLRAVREGNKSLGWWALCSECELFACLLYKYKKITPSFGTKNDFVCTFTKCLQQTQYWEKKATQTPPTLPGIHSPASGVEAEHWQQTGTPVQGAALAAVCGLRGYSQSVRLAVRPTDYQAVAGSGNHSTI